MGPVVMKFPVMLLPLTVAVPIEVKGMFWMSLPLSVKPMSWFPEMVPPTFTPLMQGDWEKVASPVNAVALF